MSLFRGYIYYYFVPPAYSHLLFLPSRLVFKLNNKQAAAELTLIWSGGVVVFYGGMYLSFWSVTFVFMSHRCPGLTYVLCLVFLEGSHLPNDGNDVTQYPNPLIIWSLCATAGTCTWIFNSNFTEYWWY